MGAVNDIFMSPKKLKEMALGKEIMIYGVSGASRIVFNWCTYHDIYVRGFLAAEDETENTGIAFLNKRIYSHTEAKKRNSADTLFIGCFYDEKEVIEVDGVQIVNISNIKSRDVVIYGAGDNGERAYELLTYMGCNVVCFGDRDETKHHKFLKGKEILSPDELERFSGCTLIVAIVWGEACKAAVEFSARNIFKNIICNKYWWGEIATITYDYDSSETDIIIGVYALYYIIRQAIPDKMRIVLFGEENQVAHVANKLRLFDIDVLYGVSPGKRTGLYKGVVFKDFFDLCYDFSNVKVFVLRGFWKEARWYMEKTGLPSDLFVKAHLSCEHIYENTCLDASMGINQWHEGFESVIPLSKKNSGSALKIAVLGGSTSQLYLYPVESLPEQIYKELSKRRRDVQILSGGVVSYTVGQELTKLIRDVIPLMPDVVISYSGINEGLGDLVYASKGHWVHRSQEIHYEFLNSHRLSYAGEHSVIYGNAGETDVSVSECWIRRERMMKALCDEFGIKFYSFFQPTLCLKKRKTIREKEIILHYGITEGSQKVYEDIKKDIKKANLNYMYDISDIFDERDEDVYFDILHLNSVGNRIVAEKMIETIGC